MFRSLTIPRELVQSLAKVTLLLKYSVKLRRCILCGDVAACHEMACVLFVVQTAVCTTKYRFHNARCNNKSSLCVFPKLLQDIISKQTTISTATTVKN